LIARFIDGQRAAGRGVESICAALREQGVQVAPRTYRSWRTNPPSTRAVSDAAIIDRLRSLRTASATGGPVPEIIYGRRKMTVWLQRAGFDDLSKHTVDRVMRMEGMRGLGRVCWRWSRSVLRGPRYEPSPSQAASNAKPIW
jgi:putative transposase